MKSRKLLNLILILTVLLGGLLPAFSNKVLADTIVKEDDCMIVTIKEDGRYSFNCDIYMGDDAIGLYQPTALSVGEGTDSNDMPIYSLGAGTRIFILKKDYDSAQYFTHTRSGNTSLQSATAKPISELEQKPAEEFTYTTEYYEPSDKSIMQKIEEMFAGLLNGIANGINYLVARVLGKAVTIDDLVFNDYSDTKLSYFAKTRPAGASSIIWGSGTKGSGGLHETINHWYSFFRNIAVIGYMIILVYMGIRIILSSTGKDMAQYKTLFMYWVMGVVILFMYPYAMKYMIELNDAFVKTIKSSRDVILKDSGKSIKSSGIKSVGASGGGIEFETFDDNPFDANGNDYMSTIARNATEYKRLSLAIAYMVLTWQLITLIIHYYKRMMIVGFLITIFPLVALSYAVDRIADGKSQAFNKWNKEFILNVFIQSFHAIVYIFVCGTVFSAGDPDSGNYDFILVIVGVTFLFTGEEIIKKIFSQESPGGSVKSLAQTAGTAYATAMIAKNAVSKTVKPFVGKDSIVNKVRNVKDNIEAADTKVRVFDKVATTFSPPNAGARLDSYQPMMEAIDNNASLSEDEKKRQKAHVKEVANAVTTINNPKSRSYKDLSEAYSVIQHELEHNPGNPLLDNTKMSKDELKALAGASTIVAASVAAGQFDPVQIKRDVKAELAYNLPGTDEETQERYANMILTNVAANGSRLYSASGTREEFGEYLNDINELNDSFHLSGVGYTRTDEENDRRAQLEAEAIAALGEDNNKNNRKLAQALVVYQNRNSNLYSTAEQLEAMQTIHRFSGRDDRDDKMNELLNSVDDDFDVARHILAKKVANTTGTEATNAERKLAKEILAQYEGENKNTRAGYADDEFAIHQIIAGLGDADALGDMYQDVFTARRRKNQEVRDTTMDIAQDILAMDGVDIMEGSIDTTTKYLNGQTREDVEREAREARFNAFFELATGSSLSDFRGEMADRAQDVIDSSNNTAVDDVINRGFSKVERTFRDRMTNGYSRSYVENMRNYNNYSRGDQS